MSTETKPNYSGWTNYETWHVALWIGNEEGSYLYWREQTTTAYRAARPRQDWTRKKVAALNLAKQLKEEIEDGNPIEVASLYSDLLGAAISDVNWYEIAANWLDDLDEGE